ncbi:MAG: beta-galactosidase [Candidatus Hydrogenedentes bacterium]|nr:beta-galactosidase [Candidatus Hydrogenedentota bacterium]
MLAATLIFTMLAAGTPAQFSFTIWDWEPAYHDIELFKRQVDTVAEYGVNTIELGVCWKDCEPADGKFEFTYPDERVAYVQSKGLALRLRVNVSDWPEWFQPELFQNLDGSTFDYSGGLPSVFSAANRAQQFQFVSALAQNYTGEGFTYTPAFSVHMEVKFGAWNTYEPSARAGFQNWLAGRYKIIDALNDAWHKSYASFGEVEAPVPENTTGVPSTDAASADWIQYREAALTDWVAAFAAVVRKQDSSAKVSVPLGESHRYQAAEFANLGYWNYSRAADEIVHSYDFFMHGANRVDDAGVTTAIMTGITERPVVFEIDGPILIEKFGYTPETLERIAELAMARGAAGIQISNWGSANLSEQIWMKSVGDIVSKLRPQIIKTTPAIRYYVSKWQNYCTRDPGVELFDEQFAALRILLDANADVRVITDENLANEYGRAFTVLVPYAPVMDDSTRERLRSVSLGTRVLAATKPGVFTPQKQTAGNFGARIEIVEEAVLRDKKALGDVLAVFSDAPRVLRVAAVQFHTCFDVAANTKQIIDWIGKASKQGARVVVFSEMALTGYTKKAEFKESLDWPAIDLSIDSIRIACKENNIYAIVGAPTRDGEQTFCAALAFDPFGEIIDRYEKTYLAGEKWATPGRQFTTFKIDDAECATIICHDERYPHLVNLRALAGAQLFFYISCESGVGEEHKIGPYRAQVQARAVENGVFLVHSNAPAQRDNIGLDGTSNGHSRIIGPDGNIIREAGAFEESMVIADIDLRHARPNSHPAALTDGPAAEWIRKGVDLVTSE